MPATAKPAKRNKDASAITATRRRDIWWSWRELGRVLKLKGLKLKASFGDWLGPFYRKFESAFVGYSGGTIIRAINLELFTVWGVEVQALAAPRSTLPTPPLLFERCAVTEERADAVPFIPPALTHRWSSFLVPQIRTERRSR